jgi:WD40 repeat protein
MHFPGKDWQIVKPEAEGLNARAARRDRCRHRCRRQAGGSHDRAVRLWTLDKSAPLVPSRPEAKPFEGHEGPIFAMVQSQDGKRILTGGDDNTVRLWDAATGEELLVLLGHDKDVRHVALAPDGKTAYSCGMDRVLRIWDLKKGVQALQMALPEKTHATAFTRDGKTLAVGLITADATGSVQLLDPVSGKKVREVGRTPNPPHYLAFSADDRWLVAVDQKLGFRIWEVGTGKGKDLKAESGHTFQVTASAFSPDGKLLVSGSGDRTISIWDVDAGKEIRKVGYFPSAIQGLVFAADGKSFFASTGITHYAAKDPKAKQPQTPRVQSGLCSMSQVDAATGRILQYWDELPGAPLRLVPLSDGRLLTTFSDTLQKWTPGNGKAPVEN